MALPLISMDLIYDALEMLKSNVPSADRKYAEFIKYFESEYMTRTALKLWHHGLSSMKTNNSLEGTLYCNVIAIFYLKFPMFIISGYNYRLLNRFGVHPSIWQFIHYLKNEESIVSHRITHLGGGAGAASSTLVYVHMQGKQKTKETQKQLKRLHDLYYSNSIGLKQYLVSASLMVGKVVGQDKNANNTSEAISTANSISNDDIDD